MKKSVLINAPISRVIALLGHGDALCVADAGLPVPTGVERIDLAVSAGLPPFKDTIAAILSELCVERAVIASELRDTQPDQHDHLVKQLANAGNAQGKDIVIDYVSHASFKGLTCNCQAVVRTGEFTPFANVILYAGVTFGGENKEGRA